MKTEAVGGKLFIGRREEQMEHDQSHTEASTTRVCTGTRVGGVVNRYPRLHDESLTLMPEVQINLV